MNKGDIDRIIQLFAEYCNEDLEFGGLHTVKNTGNVLLYTIKIKKVK